MLSGYGQGREVMVAALVPEGALIAVGALPTGRQAPQALVDVAAAAIDAVGELGHESRDGIHLGGRAGSLPRWCCQIDFSHTI